MGKRFRAQIRFFILAILVITTAGTYLVTRADTRWFGVLLSVLALILSFLFYRYLEQTKKDLQQFLLSFSSEDIPSHGTTRMLRHSKDDLNDAYHRIIQIIEKYIDEKTRNLHLVEEVLDYLRAGLIVVDEHEDIVFLNRFTKNLLFNPDLKNMSGLERLNQQLAGVMRNMEENQNKRVQIQVENEPREFLVYYSKLSFGEANYRVYTLQNIKREVRWSEQEAWSRMVEILAARLGDRDFDLKTGLSEFNKEMKYAAEKVYISECFDKVIRQSSSLFPKPKDVFRVSLSNTDLWIHADARGLVEAISELIRNAADALKGKKDPIVELRAELDLSCRVQLVVSDNGAGAGPEVLDRVFVPFYTTKKGHAGLGLSRVRKFMTAMNGTVDLVSEPGKGCTVFLRFI